jgi:hypothetical protein
MEDDDWHVTVSTTPDMALSANSDD